MKSCRVFLLVFCFLLVVLCCPISAECRFWAGISANIPENIVLDQLLTASQSLKALGEEYQDGWSVAYYSDTDMKIFRGSQSSLNDEEFDLAVQESAELKPTIILSHLRRASSGCVEDVPNPHPFKQFKNGKTWLFGHNGHIPKDILIDLIDDEYLTSHPPLTCVDNPPDSWVDSELYFRLILQKIEENNWQVEDGIYAALQALYKAIGDGRKALNFFLTDGQSVWAFRKGPTLFYTYQEKPFLSIVSSTPPENTADGWSDVGNDTLIVMTVNEFPKLIRLLL